MKRWKYILLRILWSIIAIGLVVLFVFAWKAKTVKKCTAIQIELTGNTSGFLFMDEKEILRFINEQGVTVGTPIGNINLTQLEKALGTTKWVEGANIFIDNQQQLQVKIEQRLPVARIFTASGNSFYIDKTGQRLPLRQLSVMRLPVFTGFPSDQEKLSNPDSLLLHDILTFAKTIQQDSFYLAQIAQVNIEPNGDFEMIPTLGDHTVLIGTVDNLEDKLNRLYTFYKKVWVSSGINAFHVLDVRFDHQLVALKKGVEPIKYAPGVMPFIQLQSVSDTSTSVDTIVNQTIPVVEVASKLDTASKPIIKGVSAKIVKPTIINKPVSANKVLAKKVVKANSKENIKKLNNKSNNKSLNQEKKSAKAVMPKQTPSNNN
jgi:cell division protein FtsQ